MTHRGVIHPSGAHPAMLRMAGAVSASAHPHVGHAQGRPFAKGRNGRSHAGSRSERSHTHAGTIDTLGDNGEGAVIGNDDQVVGFGIADLELVHLDRPNIDAVGADNDEFQAGDTDIEDRLSSRVDDP